MDTTPDYTPLLAFYRELLQKHHTGYQATGWGNPIIQHHNFLLAAKIEGLQSGMRILDVGCGLGDFYTFLKTRGIKVDYTGVDISPEMIERARGLHLDATFHQQDLLREPLPSTFDYVFCSGTLNLRLPNHEQWIEAMLTALYDHCDRGMTFNLLSAHHAQDREDFQHAGDFYFADPSNIFNICQNLSRRVSLNHSDNIETFNVYVYREEPTACSTLSDSLALTEDFDEIAQNVFTLACETHNYQWADAFLTRFKTSQALLQAQAQLFLAVEDLVSLKLLSEQTLVHAPENHFFHFCLALAYNKLGELRAALQHAERALSLDEDNEQYLSHTICIMIESGKRSEALQLIPKLPSEAQQAFLEGHLWHTAHAYQKARACYERAIALSPNYILAQQCLEMLPQKPD
jgi:SAM-dependent methyltransferase